MIYIPPSASDVIQQKVIPILHEVMLAVAVVGSAVLLLMVAISIWKWLRKVLFGIDGKSSSTVSSSVPGERGLGVQVDLSKYR